MLTGTLTLERLNKQGKVLERRRQPMLSFTQGFIELLYVAHANIGAIHPHTPYSMPNINLDGMDIDSRVDGLHIAKGNLLIAAPSGRGSVFPTPGRWDWDQSHRRLPAELVGIQVGTGTAALAPTDRRLDNRILHGTSLGEVSPIIFEEATGDTASHTVHGVNWWAQEVNYLSPQRVVSVRLLLGRLGLPGTVTVSLRSALTGVDLLSGTTDGNTLPTAAPWEWRTITLTPARDEYAFAEPPFIRRFIVVRATGGNASNHLIWRGAGNIYPRGAAFASSNSGAAWAWADGVWGGHIDMMFGLLRQFPNNQLEYGGCEVDNFIVANPNASFEVRRHFYNRCGATTTINEIGIYAAGVSFTERRGWPFCIARDRVIPGIAVLHGQVLRVTYTFSVRV